MQNKGPAFENFRWPPWTLSQSTDVSKQMYGVDGNFYYISPLHLLESKYHSLCMYYFQTLLLILLLNSRL